MGRNRHRRPSVETSSKLKLHTGLFECINSFQYYELKRRCSPMHLMLTLPLTHAVYPWSVHCKCAMK